MDNFIRKKTVEYILHKLVFLFSFSECSLYNGQGFSGPTGHFTHVVWKSCETFGMAAQTCNIPGKDL